MQATDVRVLEGRQAGGEAAALRFCRRDVPLLHAQLRVDVADRTLSLCQRQPAQQKHDEGSHCASPTRHARKAAPAVKPR